MLNAPTAAETAITFLMRHGTPCRRRQHDTQGGRWDSGSHKPAHMHTQTDTSTPHSTCAPSSHAHMTARTLTRRPSAHVYTLSHARPCTHEPPFEWPPELKPRFFLLRSLWFRFQTIQLAPPAQIITQERKRQGLFERQLSSLFKGYVVR
jgi:hypothetical protein